MSPGVGASQCEHVAVWVIDRVEHDDNASFADEDLDHGAAASLRIVVPGVEQARNADDGVNHLLAVKLVASGELRCGCGADEPGDP